MKGHEFAALLALRYRLIWARARRGRTVLLVVSGLFLSLGIVVAALGGIAAAAAAISTGRETAVARAGFVAMFLTAVAAGTFFGLDSGPAFSDDSLRRWPIGPMARRLVRHATALVEPVWLLMAAVVGGLGIGLAAAGDGLVVFGAAAAALLVLTAYFVAAIAAAVLTWLLTRPGGVLITIVAVTAIITAGPLAIAAVLSGAENGLPPVIAAVLAWAPPFAAATATTTGDAGVALRAILAIGAWCLACAWTSYGTDGLPRRRVAVASRQATWDHPCDRLAAPFGVMAPVAGKMLRYYLRSPQVRYNFPLALPVIALMIAGSAPADTATGMFLFVLGAAPAVGFLATGAFATNVFGFDGRGFQRYFLLPVPPSRVMVVAGLVGLIPGALIVVAGTAAWWWLSPPGATLQMAVLLLATGIGGLLFFHAIGVWTSLLAPRPIPFTATFGNKLSAPANVLFAAVMAVFFGLPMATTAVGIDAVFGAALWLLLAAVVIAPACYAATLHWAGTVLGRDRERLLHALTGV